MSSASTRAHQKSTPGEIEVHFEKITLTDLDELGVELVSPPKEFYQIARRRSRSPPRPSSAPNFTCSGATMHACGKHRASSACGKHSDEHFTTFERFLKAADTVRRTANADAYSTSVSSSNAPLRGFRRLRLKILRPTAKWIASKSGKGSGSGFIKHACGNHCDSNVLQLTDVNHTSLGRHKKKSPPQGKVVELIGRSSVERRGGAWNARLNEICMRAVEEANITFDATEVRVLTELHQRITMVRTQYIAKTRTKEEINEILTFWWKLQTYRRRYLNRKGRVDTAEEVLSRDDIMKVRRDWEDAEIYPTLTWQHRNHGHVPSIYNAALNNKCGWITVATAIIKHQLPQLPPMRTSDSVREHIQSIERFCADLLVWLRQFVTEALIYWNSREYERATR